MSQNNKQHEQEKQATMNDNIDKNNAENQELQEETVEANASQNILDDFSHDDILALQESLEMCKEENSELKDQVIRSRAELENSKKRLSRHYDDLSKERTKRLILDIIDLLDNFERALAANSSADKDESDSVLEGIKMIETQFMQTLESKWNVKRFDSLDSDFDPERHEAMMSEVDEKLTSPKIVDEFSKGYLFEDKVLRTAKVKVATPN